MFFKYANVSGCLKYQSSGSVVTSGPIMKTESNVEKSKAGKILKNLFIAKGRIRGFSDQLFATRKPLIVMKMGTA